MTSEACAYHEAGHAVAVEAVGYVVKSIIWGGDGPMTRFSVTPWDQNHRDSPAARWRLLTVTVAGPVAESIHFERPAVAEGFVADVLDMFEEGWWLVDPADVTEEDVLDAFGEVNDRGDAFLLVVDLGPEAAEKELREALQAAREILTERWSDVEAIAAARITDG